MRITLYTTKLILLAKNFANSSYYDKSFLILILPIARDTIQKVVDGLIDVQHAKNLLKIFFANDMDW